jgi:oligopeptide transport system substrate-binding protein
MLQKKWSALFGIRIILSASPWESHFQRLTEGEFDLGAIELNALWSDPFHFFEFFENKNDPLNICSWEAPAYKDLLQEARTTHTFELRSRLLKKAEQLLAQQVPAIPLYQLKGIYLKRRDVADVLTSGYFLIDFKQASRIN